VNGPGPAGNLTAWISRLYEDPELLRMGHAQSAADLNLGLGWIYYGLARLVRPRRAVVIGSWRGFVPLVIARALADNGAGGEVCFIDPSRVDDFWTDAGRVQRHWATHGLDNIRHHLCTTQAFVATAAYAALEDIGLLFVDGYHTADQARFDYEAFAGRLATGAFVLFHDSVGTRHSTRMYGPDQAYDVDVSRYMAELRRDPALQLLDLPFGPGLTIMRRAV
jgi:predicted O-methyltransferase YrrM